MIDRYCPADLARYAPDDRMPASSRPRHWQEHPAFTLINDLRVHACRSELLADLASLDVCPERALWALCDAARMTPGNAATVDLAAAVTAVVPTGDLRRSAEVQAVFARYLAQTLRVEEYSDDSEVLVSCHLENFETARHDVDVTLRDEGFGLRVRTGDDCGASLYRLPTPEAKEDVHLATVRCGAFLTAGAQIECRWRVAVAAQVLWHERYVLATSSSGLRLTPG